jgi:uncharacterized membrane protein required for colicin V production
MTLYDALMVGLVVAGMIWGAWRGITWQVASMASLVLGYLFAHPLSGPLASQFPGEPVVARTLALLAVYAAVSGGVFLVDWVIRSTLRRLRFEAFDRHLGMILGGLEGAFLGLVATLFVVSLAPETRAPIFASPTGRLVGQVMDGLGPVLPGEVRQVLEPVWASNGDAGAVGDAGPAPRPRVRDGSPRTAPAPDPQGRAAALLHDLWQEGATRVGRALDDGIERTGGTHDRAPQRR